MKNKRIILLLSIFLTVSVIGNVYQSIHSLQKSADFSALFSDNTELTQTVASLETNLDTQKKELSHQKEQISELELRITEYENQKEKYWSLAVADYKITLQEGALENTLDLMYSKDENEKLLLTLQMGNDYRTPEDISAEAFENCLGHSGFRLYKRHPLGTQYHYYVVEYYTVEDELEFLAYRWGSKDDDFYEIDIDGDGIDELICNVTWMADGATNVLIYHFDGEKVMRGHGSDLLDQPVDNYGVGSIYTTYLPEKNKIHINYWQDALQGFAEKEYSIDLDKIEWLETYK